MLEIESAYEDLVAQQLCLMHGPYLSAFFFLKVHL